MNQQITWAQILAAYMPAAIIMVTILLGIMSNNRAIDGVHRRIDDTNRHLDVLQMDTNRRFDEYRTEMSRRFDEQRAETTRRLDELVSRFDRFEQQLGRIEERLEHPVLRSS